MDDLDPEEARAIYGNLGLGLSSQASQSVKAKGNENPVSVTKNNLLQRPKSLSESDLPKRIEVTLLLRCGTGEDLQQKREQAERRR
jgi:hypothetical protein